VPLFFMISGFLLLRKRDSLSGFFKKRFRRLFIPLVAWSCFYALWSFFDGSSSPSSFSIYRLILVPAYYHLWFLYAIIGVYLYLPILQIIARYAGNNLLVYYIGLWFVAVSILSFSEELTGINSPIDLLSISGFSGYLILGLVLGEKKITNGMAYLALLLSVICVYITAMGTYYLTVNNAGIFVGDFAGYLSPNVVILSGSIFILIKFAAVRFPILRSDRAFAVIRSLGAASFGIYLIHAAYLSLLIGGKLGFSLSAFSGNPVYSVPLTAITVFLLSYATIHLLRMNPVLRKLVP